MAEPIVLAVVSPIAHPVRACPGDVIVVRPGHPRPVIVQREGVPNFGALAGLLADGALMPSDGADPAAVVALLERASQPEPE